LKYQDAAPAQNAVCEDPTILAQTFQGAPGITAGHTGRYRELSKRRVATTLFIRCFGHCLKDLKT
jgi:hypothetical protein